VPGVGQQGVAAIYEWHEGRIDYVAPIGGSAGNFSRASVEVADEGRVIFFSTEDPEITTDERGGYRQAFRYDDRDRSLECISCLPGRAPGSETWASSSGLADNGLGMGAEEGDAFVFETTDAIDRRDVNDDSDIYEWRNGQIGLVTDGVTQYPEGTGRLQLHGIGDDGDNVLFQAGVNLTGYERDNVGQLYVARAGGGFPPPPGEQAPCGEESCQGPLQPGAAALSPGSAAFSGSGNVREAPKPRKQRCTKARGRKAQKGKVRKCATKRAHNK
jgi:hypothetical protein